MTTCHRTLPVLRSYREFVPITLTQAIPGQKRYESRPNWTCCWLRKRPSPWVGASDRIGVARIGDDLYWVEVWDPTTTTAELKIRLVPRDGIGPRSEKTPLFPNDPEADFAGEIQLPAEGNFLVRAWRKATRAGVTFWSINFQRVPLRVISSRLPQNSIPHRRRLSR